jgi:hypothetical protein
MRRARVCGYQRDPSPLSSSPRRRTPLRAAMTPPRLTRFRTSVRKALSSVLRGSLSRSSATVSARNWKPKTRADSAAASPPSIACHTAAMSSSTSTSRAFETSPSDMAASETLPPPANGSSRSDGRVVSSHHRRRGTSHVLPPANLKDERRTGETDGTRRTLESRPDGRRLPKLSLHTAQAVRPPRCRSRGQPAARGSPESAGGLFRQRNHSCRDVSRRDDIVQADGAVGTDCCWMVARHGPNLA